MKEGEGCGGIERETYLHDVLDKVERVDGYPGWPEKAFGRDWKSEEKRSSTP